MSAPAGRHVIALGGLLSTFLGTIALYSGSPASARPAAAVIALGAVLLLFAIYLAIEDGK